jgi:hypothetical protein
MSTMKMPGFTAEVSLNIKCNDYKRSVISNGNNSNQIIPQLRATDPEYCAALARCCHRGGNWWCCHTYNRRCG